MTLAVFIPLSGHVADRWGAHRTFLTATVATVDGGLRTASEHSEPELFWALRGIEHGDGRTSGESEGEDRELRFVGRIDALSPMLDALVKRAGIPATSRKAAPTSYLDAMRYFAGSSEKESFVGSSRILTGPLPDAGDLVGVVTGLRGTDPLFDGLGGAGSRAAPDATAFPHRQALASAQVYVSAQPGKRAEAEQTLSRVQGALARLVGTGAYVNYLDPGQRDWATAYYGDNLPRLRQVACHYAPERILTFPQSVNSA